MPPEELFTNKDVKDLYRWMGDINRSIETLAAMQEKSEEQLIRQADSIRQEAQQTAKDLTGVDKQLASLKAELNATVKERARFWGILTFAISTAIAIAAAFINLVTG